MWILGLADFMGLGVVVCAMLVSQGMPLRRKLITGVMTLPSLFFFAQVHMLYILPTLRY
jgi:hypothetical protein